MYNTALFLANLPMTRLGIWLFAMLLLPMRAWAAPADSFLETLTYEFFQDGMRLPRATITARHAEACAAGVALACSADQWVTADRLDRSAARSVFEAACGAGDPVACVVLGWLDVQVEWGQVSARAGDPAAAALHFQAACDAGLARGCAELANLLLRGVGVEKDPQRAQALLIAACQSGVGNACMGLGDRWEDTNALERAAESWDRGCLLGDGLSCRNLAKLREDDAPDEAQALRVRACELGVSEACLALFPVLPAESVGPTLAQAQLLLEADRLSLSGMIGKPVGSPADMNTVNTLADECAAGEEGKCRIIWLAIDGGEVPKAMLAFGLSTFQRACTSTPGLSCRYLALMHLHAMGTGYDPIAGMDALKRGCDANNQLTCVTLGWYKVNGRGLGHKPGEARTLWESACETGEPSACAALSQGWQGRFWGKKASPGLVFQYAERACLLDMASCVPLARLYLRGVGTRSDPVRAAALSLSACEDGAMAGCVGLAWATQAGRGLARDEQKADALFRRACAGGSRSGCAQVAVAAIAADQAMPDGKAPGDVLREGCNSKSVAACAGRGWTYVRGIGMPPDLTYGTALLKTACSTATSVECRWGGCEVESALACRWLAEQYTEGLGVERDAREAQRLYQSACEDGDLIACEALNSTD